MFPSRSQLAWELPPGWFVRNESVTLQHPGGIANVIFSSEPVPTSWDSVRYSEEQGHLLRQEFRGFHETEEKDFTLRGVGTGVMRRFTWTPEDGIPVTQVQIYAVRNGRGYTATATAPSNTYESIKNILEGTLDRLSVMAPWLS